MCGITGFVDLDGLSGAKLRTLRGMTSRLAHRGPDGQGTWQRECGRVNLGHTRLAIIDLSPSGAQPMLGSDGRSVLTFNGEIYNYREIRLELERGGAVFRGTSDTEVLLEALLRWGVAATLPRLNGMFAIAYWEESSRSLWLARDRFGEKPLYYTQQRNRVLFASEIKALRAHPDFEGAISRSAVVDLLRLNYVPQPYSIYSTVKKLPPACFIRVNESAEIQSPVCYWPLGDQLAKLVSRRTMVPDDQIVTEVERELENAVKLRMLSDVPLGAFLSGGIDSSVVVAMMQKNSVRPVRTFTIGFWESGYDEATDAARVAKALGTEHHEYYISSKDCVDVITRLPDIYDEPFADSSQIPTVLVSEFTRHHVTVALSGDAGDEFFGGYNRYLWTKKFWPMIKASPLYLRKMISDLGSSLSPGEWERIIKMLNFFAPKRWEVRAVGDKIHKFSNAIRCQSIEEIYSTLVRHWNEEDIYANCGSAGTSMRFAEPVDGLEDIEKMMYWDQLTYLSDDILCKVDRGAMSTGLEARVPFLDNKLVELSWNIPASRKLRRDGSKWPLRTILGKYVPQAIFDRPKSGFNIPIGDWLRGPLRPWAEELLNKRSISDSGFFNAPYIAEIWKNHLAGSRNEQHRIWSILMFQDWYKKVGK